jgi:hypothetical protein
MEIVKKIEQNDVNVRDRRKNDFWYMLQGMGQNINKDRLTHYPDFIGKKEFHDSHKSKLLFKKPEHYSQFNWNVPSDLEYVWPVK